MKSSQKQIIATHYDGESESYGRRYQGYKKIFYDLIEIDAVINLLGDQKGGAWLDVGTGEGRFPRAVVDLVSGIIGIDISEKMIQVASNSITNSKIKFYKMDFLKTSFPDLTFDAIISLGAFEYIDDLNPYLKEGHRIGRKKARIVFTCHNSDALIKTKSNGIYELYMHRPISIEKSLVENGWNVVKIDSIFHISGRWIWILCRVMPSFLRLIFIKSIVKINRQLTKWGPTSMKGRVLIVCGEKNDDIQG